MPHEPRFKPDMDQLPEIDRGEDVPPLQTAAIIAGVTLTLYAIYGAGYLVRKFFFGI